MKRQGQGQCKKFFRHFGRRVTRGKAGLQYQSGPVDRGTRGILNANFHTFRACVADERTNGRTDKASYRVASSRLKLTANAQKVRPTDGQTDRPTYWVIKSRARD